MDTTTSIETPLMVVQRHIRAFNEGDARGMATCFARDGSILDGMAPHIWQGPSAASDWYRDVLIEGEHTGAGDYFVTPHDPLHDNATDDAAYIVSPATMTFNVHDRQVTQKGAIFTVALRKTGKDWRVAAWAWAKGQASASAVMP